MTERQRIVNIADIAMHEAGNGKGFKAKIGRAGPMLGLGRLGCALTVVPPGQRGRVDAFGNIVLERV